MERSGSADSQARGDDTVGDPVQTTVHDLGDHWKATFPVELARALDLDDGTKLTWRRREDGSIVVEPTETLIDKVRRAQDGTALSD